MSSRHMGLYYIRVLALSRFVTVSVLLMVFAGYATAGVWDAYTQISSAFNPPIKLVPAMGPYLVNSEITFHMEPLTDYDRCFTAPSTNYYELDSFLAQDAYTWSVKDAGGIDKGSFKYGDNTNNATFPNIIWIAPSTPENGLTVSCSVKDDPKAIGEGDTGTRDDPNRVWSVLNIRVGGAFISELDGNVAGDYISGTNVSVRMYVENMYLNTDHTVSVLLGASDLATGSSHVKVDPVSPAGQPIIRTDASGNWQSAGNKGWVYFDTTHLLSDGSTGDLNIKLVPSAGNTYFSNTMEGKTVYNKGYVLGGNSSTIYGAGSATNVNFACGMMKHSTRFNSTEHKPTIETYLPAYTVFYIYTHGGWDVSPYSGETMFRDCDSVKGEDVSAHCLPSSTVANAVSGKGGSIPYYNIVHIDACDSAGDGSTVHTDMAGAFGISSGATDRAYLGFNGNVNDNLAHANWTYTVWTNLRNGQTIGTAVTNANNSYNPGGTAHIIGDSSSTLHKVY